MLYRLPSEFCAYFTPFLGLNRRWLSPVGCRRDEWLPELQQRCLPYFHGSGNGVSRNLRQIQ